MNCPTCNTQMQERGGAFGKFMFCPNQAVCKQKTISEASYPQQPSPMSPQAYQEVELSNEPLMQEMRIQEAELGPLFVPSQEDFINGLGEPVDYHGDIIGNEGNWFRPY